MINSTYKSNNNPNPRGLSIIITTYNASDFITETFNRLLQMQKVPDLPWEIIVVDNNSTDDTLKTVNTFQSTFPNLIVKNEAKQGVGFASLRGMQEAKYEYIGIIDQDNWVHANWMINSVTHMDNSPNAGIICGKGIPVFESNPPDWFMRFQNNFAVGEQSKQNGPAPNPDTFYYNAGCIMRKTPVNQIMEAGFQPLLISRSEKRVLAGDDTEIQLLLRLLGWEIHYQGDITFDHFMPNKRLSYKYFRDLRKGLGASSVYLNIYRIYSSNFECGKKKKQTNWFQLLNQGLVNVIKDPLALIASFHPKYASNYRVARYWSKLGEFEERLAINSKYSIIYKKLFKWLDELVI